MPGLSTRLDRLERDSPFGRHIFLWRDDGVSDEQLIASHQAARQEVGQIVVVGWPEIIAAHRTGAQSLFDVDRMLDVVPTEELLLQSASIL